MNLKNFGAIVSLLDDLGFPEVNPTDKFSIHYYSVGLISVDVRYHDGERRNATFTTVDDDGEFGAVERFNPSELNADTRLNYIKSMTDSGISYGTVARIFDTTVTRIRSLIETQAS